MCIPLIHSHMQRESGTLPNIKVGIVRLCNMYVYPLSIGFHPRFWHKTIFEFASSLNTNMKACAPFGTFRWSNIAMEKDYSEFWIGELSIYGRFSLTMLLYPLSEGVFEQPFRARTNRWVDISLTFPQHLRWNPRNTPASSQMPLRYLYHQDLRPKSSSNESNEPSQKNSAIQWQDLTWL